MPFTPDDLKQIKDAVVGELKVTPTPVIPPPASGMDWTRTAGTILTTAILGVIAARQNPAPMPTTTISAPTAVAPAPVSDTVALKLADHEARIVDQGVRIKSLEDKLPKK